MKAITEKWSTVEPLARGLGVKPYALAKWRQRGNVPSRWFILLIQKSAGNLTLDDFS